MTVAITRARYLQYVEPELDAFVAAARSVAPDAMVSSYPRYTVGTLAGHVAEILNGVTATIETGVYTVPAADHMPPGGAEAIDALAAAVAPTLATVRAADPDQPLEHFFTSAPQVVGFYPRYLAIEIAIHRWDVESAAGRHRPMAAELAVDAINDLFTTWMPLGFADLGAVTKPGTVAVSAPDAGE